MRIKRSSILSMRIEVFSKEESLDENRSRYSQKRSLSMRIEVFSKEKFHSLDHTLQLAIYL